MRHQGGKALRGCGVTLQVIYRHPADGHAALIPEGAWQGATPGTQGPACAREVRFDGIGLGDLVLAAVFKVVVGIDDFIVIAVAACTVPDGGHVRLRRLVRRGQWFLCARAGVLDDRRAVARLAVSGLGYTADHTASVNRCS
jgi:hypothetical protein